MKTDARFLVAVSLAWVLWLAGLAPATTTAGSPGQGGAMALPVDGMPTWPIPADIPPGPPPIPVMPAAGDTPPPPDVIADPVTPGATCSDWYVQDRYAGTGRPA